jgi:hypothetical protein
VRPRVQSPGGRDAVFPGGFWNTTKIENPPPKYIDWKTTPGGSTLGALEVSTTGKKTDSRKKPE